MKKYAILTHGGAGSKNDYADGTLKAAEIGLEGLRSGSSVLESVCRATVALEDDTRFNAGVGSRRRSDGSVQMDAACMDSGNRFGAVAVIEGFKNPILVAYALIGGPCRILGGEGAARFARERGFETFDFKTALESRHSVTDTVGCVAYDGKTFAAALSTGGTGGSPPGRVGDVPLIGCGLYVGPCGAVAATGHGESIAMNMTAYRAYLSLERGESPSAVLQRALSWFAAGQDIGLILVGLAGYAGGSNRSMAWSALESD
ncbi:MAG: isoaspartyl peptidase/L-asparaginase [Nitrospinae bacterium]|nr:isoaspartyl peptidase/L-asparaginase [Nitrospinota bacterium]